MDSNTKKGMFFIIFRHKAFESTREKKLGNPSPPQNFSVFASFEE